MLKLAQSINAQVSTETGLLKRQRGSIRFHVQKHVFESKLERILRAAAGHEGNSLPSGNRQYQVLATEANSLCTQFANQWSLDVELLRAQIPGLTKLVELSVGSTPTSYASLAGIGMLALPVALFLLGVMAGLLNRGFHLVGGR